MNTTNTNVSANGLVAWVVKIGLLIMPILPLVVTQSLYFPFITGKNFIFRIVVEVIFVAWLWLILTNSKYRPRASVILYSMVTLIAVLFLATVFGVWPYKGFWSNFERMEGFWAFWHYFLYFLMLATVFKESRDWSRWFAVSLMASVVESFYGLLQLLGKLDVHQGDRLDGTLGNATYLAVYLVFHIFLFTYFFFKTRNRWLRLLMAALALFETFILYHTATRGAILGFLAGWFVFALVTAWAAKGRVRKWAVAALIVAGLIPFVFWAAKDTSFVRNSDVLNRFAKISFTETTTQSRFIIWGMALKAWKERPVLGWGPESFVYIFSKYYDPQMWRQEPWFDRAHNVFLDWLTSTGALGLLVYLGVYVSVIFTLFKLFKRKLLEPQALGVMLGLFAAYLVNNIFVFDNFVSYLMFFALVAYWHTRYVASGADVSDEHHLETAKFAYPGLAFPVGVTGLSAMVIVFSLYQFNIKPILASRSIIEALRLVTYSRDETIVRDLGQGMAALRRGINYNTFGTSEVREQLAQYADRVNRDPATPSNDKKEFIKFALEQMEKQSQAFPYDVRSKAFLSTLYGLVGDHTNSILAAKEGLAVSSKRQQFYFLLGEAYFEAGEGDLAVELLRQAYELAPEFPDAVHNYAVTLIFAGRSPEAEALLKKHFGMEIYPDLKYINAYVAIGRLDKVVIVWEKLVERSPANVQYRLSLASVYLKTFQDQKAIREIEMAMGLSPGFKTQGEIFIKQIKEGRIER
ncbi:MAG: O-antigen ligase family protein [Parcubacteria group bacterium]|nr:O-antigen ligase family protein [Parcubacteria group bacterium]